MKTRAAITLAIAVALLAVSSADAAVTVKYLSSAPATNLTIYHPFAPTGETFDVGVLNVEVDLEDPDPAFQTQAFCIDLKQYASPSPQPYGLHPLEFAPNDGGSPYTVMGVFKANAIRELWGEHFADVVDATSAAAFQSAIWEIIYENANNAPSANPWDLSSGNLAITDSSVSALANSWLSEVNDQSVTLETQLAALTNYTSSNQFQDIIIKLPGGDKPPVPEPLTVLSLTMGLCGLGAYVRKRTVA